MNRKKLGESEKYVRNYWNISFSVPETEWFPKKGVVSEYQLKN